MATRDEDFTAEAPQRSPPASVSDATPPSSDVLPPVRLKSALKAQNAVAMQPAEGKWCHTPVTARLGKDMIGAHTERSTGITCPYNLWGPCNPTRFGTLGEMPPERSHRHNYQGKHVTCKMHDWFGVLSICNLALKPLYCDVMITIMIIIMLAPRLLRMKSLIG